MMRRILIFCFVFFVQVFAGASSEGSALGPCPECLSGDRTAEEIKALSFAACEQVVKSEQCQGVEPKYLRDCEEEEEEGTLAFGQRVLGCMKGTALEGAIGLGIGAVIGKVIVGIGALLSLPLAAPILGVAAGGGATLYAFVEYDRAYREVEPGEGRALRAMGQLLGNIGTGIYRLLLGNYECYNPQGRAWEVCGLLSGAGFLTVSASATTPSAKKLTKKYLTGSARRRARRAARRGQVPKVTNPKHVELTRKNMPGTHFMERRHLQRVINEDKPFTFETYQRLRNKIIPDNRIEKAFKLPGVSSRLRSDFNGVYQAVKALKAVKTDPYNFITDQQAKGLSRMSKSRSGEWEKFLQGIREIDIPLNKGLDIRRGMGQNIRQTDPLDERALLSYIDRKKAFEKASKHSLTPGQTSALKRLQNTGSDGKHIVRYDDVVEMIKKQELSPDKFRQLVDKDLISTDEAINREVRSLIKQYESVN